MQIKVKTTGSKKGSVGYVIRVPIKDIEKISDEDISQTLKRVYGTDKIKISYGRGIKSFRLSAARTLAPLGISELR